MIGYDKITFDTKAPITDACIFVQFHYVDNKWDPCDLDVGQATSARHGRRGRDLHI